MADTIHHIALAGCTPEPLMSYLKALGILRLVSEQKDSEARGWWQNDTFWLRSRALFKDLATEEGQKEARDTLARFFLDEYKPTPIVAPWNAGSGFYIKWNEKKNTFKSRDATTALSRIESSMSSRFQPYRDQIQAIKETLKSIAKPVDPAAQIKTIREHGRREGWNDKKTKDEVKKLFDSQMLFVGTNADILAIDKGDKDVFVRECRSNLLRDQALQWLDAAFVIRVGEKKNRVEAPLLGSGGNIGNSDFSARFMQILPTCIPLTSDEPTTGDSERLLRDAIFGGSTFGLACLAVDQFDPGRAGGANMHQGMEAGFRLNPWDYILMIEGAMFLQGASSKRFGAYASGSVFPFAVGSTPGGFVSCGSDTTRGEQWLPLWSRACSASEIRTLLAEGRSELAGKPVQTGVDFARAVASLGVDRGIKQFVRVQYQARFGDNYLANALGRMDVIQRGSVDLLRQIDSWLDQFRKAVRDKNAPARFITALRLIDSAIFDFCKHGGNTLFQRIVIALGQAERELAGGERFRNENRLSPLNGLSTEWVAAAKDNTVEFEIALALAGICDRSRKIGSLPLRANLEPVEWPGNHGGLGAKWAKEDRAVVWNSADLSTNLAAVLRRRLMDGARNGCSNLPLAAANFASLSAVSRFLAGELDERRIEDLLWGLMLLPQVRGMFKQTVNDTDAPPLPRAYALLKLLFLPPPLTVDGSAVKAEPSIVSLLTGGHIGQACRIAMRRLRASGLSPLPRPRGDGIVRDADWQELENLGNNGRHLAAALLLPLSYTSIDRLRNLVLRKTTIEPQTT